MCIIISDPYTITEDIEVFKLCRLVKYNRELRSEWEPDRRSTAVRKEERTPYTDRTVIPGEGGKDILYRHKDDVGKRILITNEYPGFCVFKSIDELRDWKEPTYEMRDLQCIIPAGAKIYDIGHFMDFHHNGYATNMLEINCNDPWPA